jgi:hypothetical protein
MLPIQIVDRHLFAVVATCASPAEKRIYIYTCAGEEEEDNGLAAVCNGSCSDRDVCMYVCMYDVFSLVSAATVSGNKNNFQNAAFMNVDR